MSIFDTTPQDRYAVAPPPLAERPINDFGQSFRETTAVDRISYVITAPENAAAQYFEDIAQKVEAATGKPFLIPDVTTRNMPGEGELPPEALIGAGLAMGTFREPGRWAKDIANLNKIILENGLDIPILSAEEHDEALSEMVFQSEKKLGETEQSFWGSLAGAAYADFLSMGQNPVYGATNLVGGAAVKVGTSLLSNFGRAFLSNGLINMAITGAVAPATKKWRNDVGLKYSFAQIAAEFGGSFVLGGALGGAISVPTHLLVNGATPGQRFAKVIDQAVADASPQQIDAALSNREVLAGIRALQADGVPIPPAVRGAADEIEAQTELFDDNPLDGDDAEIEHIVRAVEAEIALENDTPIRVPDQPAAAPAEPASTPTRDPAPEGQIAVFDSVGNQQNLEVVARSPNGGVIVRLPDGKELLLGSELTKFDPLSPDFVVDALPNAPRISGLPDRELASLEASRLERIADFEAEDATNQGGYEQAKRDLTAARAETGRRRQPRSYVRPITDVNYYDNLDDTIFRFDPADVEVDAAVFQFKGSGDAVTGVTNEYRGVTEWDPNKAGQVLVYEHTDGRRIIADGHQRLGMAKRIMANDPSQKPKLYGSLLREADGITPEMARVIAAKKNIGEGSGTAVDAAEILRLDPDALTDTSLRRSTEMFRNARDMMDLGPGAFDLVKKGVIPENQAAIVGRLVKDPDQQMAVMRLLSDIEPGNLTEAEAIVRQAINAEFDNVTTLDMFGEEQIAESLFKERAKVLDATLKLLRNERAVFNSLVKNEGRISGEGNVLATEQNRTRSQTDGEAIATIQKAANRKGELSDALTAAARAFKETGKLSSASSGFADAVRGSITRGEFDSVDVGGEIGAVDVAPEINQLAAGPSKDVLDGFDNPDGPAVKQQADQLEQGVINDPGAEVIGTNWRSYLDATGDSIEIARDAIIPIRARPDGIANARKFMAQAAVGETDKRGPLTVKDNGDGTYTLLDGNSTYAVATEAGMETLPVRVLTDEQFATEIAQKNAQQMIELGPTAKKKRVVLAQDLEPVELRRLAGTLKSRQAYTSIDDILARNNAFNGELNAVVKRAAGEHEIDYRPGDPKERGRIEEKIQDKYAGDLNQIADASRASVTVTRPDEADAFIKELGATYHIVDEGYEGGAFGSEDYSGYFDRKLMVINNDGLIGEVIIIERNMYDAKHNQGGHALYKIVRGDEELDKIFPKIADTDLRQRLEALRNDRPALEAAAKQAMIDLYESVLPKMSDEFNQVVGSALRSPPNTAISVSNSAAVNSGVRVSDSSSLAEISPQAPSDFNINALPSSRSTAGIEPSSEKNLIDQTSGDSVNAAPQNYNTETGPQGQQTLIPGVEPVTGAQRAQLAVDRPMRGGDAPMNEGLFDTDARAQTDLLDLVPVGQELDPSTGNLIPTFRSKRELVDEIRQDEAMLDRFKDCV